ncbi:glycoprotein 3-alpha-L-fucosyltransferase A-like [Actinia tenebrosa]|uniref:Fucosyltransferase n=1 Tax=Actinia tenebrosa TaxID=6105 RepID=A0A6P8HT11_ACTTE|nr:glycoprotein 3-alpha-L-fucosyltransferase A-like [Actinia tenebrosa]
MVFDPLFNVPRSTVKTTATTSPSRPKEVKTILFYTSFFGQLPWPHTIGREKNLTDFSNRPCKIAACNFSISKDDISRSSVVVFHGYFTPSPMEMKALVLKKPRGQMWAWFNEESPASTSYPLNKLKNMFELTITHLHESDIHTLYGDYFSLNHKSKIEAQKLYSNRNFTEGKDRLVLWLASNCRKAASLRLNIVKEIAKYIQVDVYGGCQKYFKQTGRCWRRTRDCQRLNERYKFYLSFENSNCKGYLTEKYWENALDRNVVPVVIAGSYNKDVLIPGSYIDILDFPNAEALAKYLHYLDKNETAYNSYFEWKTKYGYTRETNWICDLCEYLHTNKAKDTTWDLGILWGEKENCHADDYRINIWINRTRP